MSNKTYTKEEILKMVMDATMEVAKETNPLAALIGIAIAMQITMMVDDETKEGKKEDKHNA